MTIHHFRCVRARKFRIFILRNLIKMPTPKNTSVGIDIGTYQIKVAVAVRDEETGAIKITGKGYSESRGMRHGYIVNTSDVSRALKKAILQAEKSSGIRVKDSYLSIGGVGLESIRSTGSSIISRGDNMVTELDVEHAISASESALAKPLITNRKILTRIPLSYKIDGKEILGRPAGMRGVKLEAETLFITCFEQHYNDLIEAVEDAGLRIVDVLAAPLAASVVTLSKAQKVAGCVLANIGSETVSIIVYENDIPISLKVFPIGSGSITNDIALGLQIPLDEAEQIKLGGIIGTDVSRKKLSDIVSSRVSDIFGLINAHLKEINKDGLLPAGIVITGGGSGITTIEDIAKATLKLPSQVASLYFNSANYIQDSSWAVSFGLCRIGLENSGRRDGNIKRIATHGMLVWVKKFLP